MKYRTKWKTYPKLGSDSLEWSCATSKLLPTSGGMSEWRSDLVFRFIEKVEIK